MTLSGRMGSRFKLADFGQEFFRVELMLAAGFDDEIHRRIFDQGLQGGQQIFLGESIGGTDTGEFMERLPGAGPARLVWLRPRLQLSCQWMIPDLDDVFAPDIRKVGLDFPAHLEPSQAVPQMGGHLREQFRFQP